MSTDPSGIGASAQPPSLHILAHPQPAARSLPEAITRLFGREADIASVSSALIDDGARLVTVTGIGGIGKTRVAIEVARFTADTFANGVVFVSLAPVKNAARVAFAISDQLGLPETPNFDPVSALQNYFGARVVLLVLDNFEHVLEAAPTLSTLLSHCPNLSILVTSRASLRIGGEREIRLQPLIVPDRLHARSFDEKLTTPAVQLFADRGRLARPAFAVDQSNVDLVSEICRMLDGLPLAIELAAARAKYLSLPILQERLGDRIAALDRGFSDAPYRHQSLRAAIDWSHDLLDPSEQLVFRRLSVFAGTFNLQAAIDVALSPSPSLGDNPETIDPTLPELESLIDKCLLNAEVLPDETRFWMHETIRQYAQSKLAEVGEVESIRIRLAAHYLGCARHISSLLDGKEVSRALGQLEVELPNIRAAMESALSRGDPETVLTIASALDSGWYYHGHLDEGRQYLKRALALDGASDIARLDGQFTATVLAMLQGDHTEIDASFTSMCDTANRIGYPMGSARAHLSMGASQKFRGSPYESERYLAEAVRILEGLTSPRWTANVLMLLSDAVSHQGDLERAERLASEALALSTEIGHTWTQAHANTVLSYVHRRRGNTEEAARFLTAALGQFEEIGDLRGIAGSVAGYAAHAAGRKDFQYTAQLLGFARGLSDSIGVVYYTSYIAALETASLARVALGDAAFDAAFAAGRRLEREAVLTEVRAILEGRLRDIPDNVDRLAKHYRLTRKETEVFRELVKRRTNAEIADACFIELRTAQDHVQHIMNKLGVKTRWDAAARLDEF